MEHAMREAELAEERKRRGKKSRNKGGTFEREICAILRDELGDDSIRRNLSQTRGGAAEGSDISVGRFSIECKRRASIAVYEWLEQAMRDAGPQTPLVIARGDGKPPIVIMYLGHFIPIMREVL